MMWCWKKFPVPDRKLLSSSLRYKQEKRGMAGAYK
jgi:hypothetical protein